MAVGKWGRPHIVDNKGNIFWPDCKSGDSKESFIMPNPENMVKSKNIKELEAVRKANEQRLAEQTAQLKKLSLKNIKTYTKLVNQLSQKYS